MREIVLDTETTGLDPNSGHRMVEIACLEIVDLLPTGQHFHVYLNPGRDVSPDAYRVHGLSYEFLRKHPSFAEQVDPFLDFIGDSPLVIHNASFDMKFLRYELKLHKPEFAPGNPIVDTLVMARKKFPGSPASLDALCKRFNIDLSGREKHGALTDTRLLAEVYLELRDGRRPGLDFGAAPGNVAANTERAGMRRSYGTRKRPLTPRFDAETLKAQPGLPEALRLAAEKLLREV